MINCCKVIVTFIGPRPVRTPERGSRIRFGNHFQSHGDAEGVLAMLEDVCRLERELDPGIPMDTVLVCNGGWPSKADTFIKEINGMQTARGTMRVVERDNTGLSFGGYSHVFELLRNKYKFWVFTEDDVLFVQPNYVADSLALMRDTACHFVSSIMINDKHRRPHAYGGVGLTRRGALDRVAKHCGGKLPYADKEPRMKSDGSFKHYAFVRFGEVALTNTMVQLGMKLEELSGMTRFYYKWKQLNP